MIVKNIEILYQYLADTPFAKFGLKKPILLLILILFLKDWKFKREIINGIVNIATIKYPK